MKKNVKLNFRGSSKRNGRRKKTKKSRSKESKGGKKLVQFPRKYLLLL